MELLPVIDRMEISMNEKKILVVLTGGTIGSLVDNKTNTIVPRGDSPYRLIQQYVDKFGVNDEFIVEQPYTILSENINLDIWNQLCRYIQSKNLENYAGIIITHGTDTYSYTSALLSVMFEKNVDIPVVIISSNYALGEPKSNGMANFRNAVCFIHEQTGVEKGIFAIYENKNGVSEVFRGIEITEADTCIDQFGAFGGEVYGNMIQEHFIKNTNHTNRCLQVYDDNVDKNGVIFKNDVILLKNYPGLNYDYIFPEIMWTTDAKKPKAVVHYLYHSATACVEGKDENSFLKFAERCHAHGITLYAAGFKIFVKDEYATMKTYEQANIIKLYDMSPEAAYAYALVKENQHNFQK